jgi:DNA-binding transcriptional regulator YiaG
MSRNAMTPAELRAARARLGLSPCQLASLLRVSETTVRRWEMAPDKRYAQRITERTAAQVQAYLDGYRPADWPGKT